MTTRHTDRVMSTAAQLLRKQIAVKRDCLVGRQRRQFSPSRQMIIDRLGEQYRDVYAVQLDTE